MKRWQTLEEGWKLHLTDQELYDDPMPFYHELRSKAPVYKTPDGFWVVTDYANTLSILRDDRDRGDDLPWTRTGVEAALPSYIDGEGMLAKYFTGKMNFNAEQHARMRKLLMPDFQPKSVETLRQSTCALAYGLIDEIEASGAREMDMVADFGLAIPTRVILTLLGIDLAETDAMNKMSDDIVYSFEPAAQNDAEWQERIENSLVERRQFILQLAEERRRNPTDDLFSRLVAGMHESPPLLSEDELVMNVLFLVVAGLETTANSIASGVHLFLTNPDQLALLRSDWDLLPGAIEEIMRIAPATRGSAPKWALWDVEMGGVKITTGEQIRTSTIAANRDPAEFDDPDRFDIQRDLSGNRQLAFAPFSGFYCLGHALARMEMTEAFKALFERCPDLQLADEVVHYKKSMQIYGPRALHVKW